MYRERDVPLVVKHKYSNTPGVSPSADSMVAAQIAINLADRKLFTKNLAGDVIELGGSSTAFPITYVNDVDVPAVNGNHYVFLRVGSIVLPTDPIHGDTIIVSNYSLQRPVDPEAPEPTTDEEKFPLVKWDWVEPIMGNLGDLMIDANFYTITLVYDGSEPETSELGWIIK